MAEDIKSLDQLKDAVTANAGAVQGSTADEAHSLQPAAELREPQRDEHGPVLCHRQAQGRGRPRLGQARIRARSP